MKFKSAKTKKIFVTLSNLPRAVKLIWSTGKGWTIAQILLLVIRGGVPASLVYLTKLFVDALVTAVNENGNPENIYRVVLIAALFGAAMLLSEILGSVIQMIYAAQAERLTDRIFGMIHDKSVKADLAYYEQPEFFDHLYRARNQAFSRPQEVVVQLGSLLQNMVTLVAMSLILIRYGAWLPVVLLVIALPTFYVVLSSSARMHSRQRASTGEERRSFYFDRLLTNGEFAAEVRLFGLGDYFKAKFNELRVKLRRERLRLSLRQRVLELSASFTALVLTAAVFGWILWRTMHGFGTIGDLALFYQVFNQGQNLLKSFLADIGRLYANSLFLGDLFEFLDLEPQIVSPIVPSRIPQTLKHGISIEDVSFRYADGKQDAIKNFSLFLPASKIVAVVGANGAGKSTLLKLICRFYDPQQGAIKFDETDLREFSLDELRGMITVLFQTPVRYSATASENIALGNIERISEIEKIEQAARAAGASEVIEKFPKRYAQMLSHRFAEGDEISVGEWQRIALARAVFREAPLMLLDEPTSAMDPWAEADWLKRFVEQAKGKTVLIITHRFTTAMRADLIYVMQNGEIVEQGSHSELVSKGGRYAESWKEQTIANQFETLDRPQ
jgi:ATP-binding cassette subfamily B protein